MNKKSDKNIVQAFLSTYFDMITMLNPGASFKELVSIFQQCTEILVRDKQLKSLDVEMFLQNKSDELEIDQLEARLKELKLKNKKVYVEENKKVYVDPCSHGVINRSTC